MSPTDRGFRKAPARRKSQAENDAINLDKIHEAAQYTDWRRLQPGARHSLMDTARTPDYLPNRESVRHAVDGRIVITPPPGFGDAWAGG